MLRQFRTFFSRSVRENGEEIMDLTRQAQIHFSGAVFLIYALYACYLLAVETWMSDLVFCLLICGMAGINWLLFKLNVVSRRHILAVGNGYTFLLLLVLLLTKCFGNGFISETLIAYTAVSTVVLSLHPLQYSVLVCAVSLLEWLWNCAWVGPDFLMWLLLFLEKAFLTTIMCCLNLYISFLRYRVFQEMSILKQDAMTDGLTGLHNRKYLEQYFRRYYQEGMLSALLHMDLDNFKPLNDTLGHQAGDAALVRVAQILREHFRKTDCVARVGGDEFMVFMPDLSDPVSAGERIEALLERFPVSVEGQGGKIDVSISVGVALSGRGRNDSYQTLYDLADSAMYQAKAHKQSGEETRRGAVVILGGDSPEIHAAED